jgi:hypothetical protein
VLYLGGMTEQTDRKASTCEYEWAPDGTMTMTVCVVHGPELALYPDEMCAHDTP